MLVFQLLFPWVAMVRIRIECAEPPSQLPLLEIKKKVREAILGNPRLYTWAPPEEIVGRVNAARTIASLINSIFRD